MDKKFISRYHSFCQSLIYLSYNPSNDLDNPYVLPGVAQSFNLAFDLAWKVMKDILIKKMEILDFAVGSPRETLQAAYQNGLIFDDAWFQMLKTRNQLAHDYNGLYVKQAVDIIFSEYYTLMCNFRERAAVYYTDECFD